MCGIFGVVNYGKKPFGQINEVLKAIAITSTERGTDATGIAYVIDRKIVIEKAAKPANKFKIAVPLGTKAVIGHTRHSTQGSEKENFNNHPFLGKCQQFHFALAHNGILSNDQDLRKKLKLPSTKIKTDSYIAVQLIEKKGNLSMDSLKFMAEKVSGSFTFSVLDEQNNLYIVKGDNPVCVLHFKDLGLYVYASTEKILWRGIFETNLFKEIKSGNYEEVTVNSGEILKICNNGKLEKAKFEYDEWQGYGLNWWGVNTKASATDDYLEELKTFGKSLGYDPKDIENLRREGFSCLEIEEILYEADYSMCEI